MNDKDSVSRFSNRVENYVKYRPHYPKGMISLLEKELKIDNRMNVADIGSGTGISAMQFIEAGYTVYGIEPNDKMRSRAEEHFTGVKNFISIKGTAESTTLNNKSVDLLIAGQAFHWFEKSDARKEFKRILKDDGQVILFWNRKHPSSGFMNEYTALLGEFGTDYNKVKHESYDSHEAEAFFRHGSFRHFTMTNKQILDFAGIEGRLLSSSYIPLAGEAFDQMISKLKTLYEKYNSGGTVELKYITDIFSGQL